MTVSIVARGPSNVRMRFKPGLVGPASSADNIVGATAQGKALLKSQAVTATDFPSPNVLSDWLSEIQSAVRFGAVGGGANDTAALTDMAEAAAGGVRSQLLDLHLVDTPLIVDFTNATDDNGTAGGVTGRGSGASRITWAGGNDSAILTIKGDLATPGVRHTNTVFGDFSMNQSGGQTGTIGLDLRQVAYFKMQNMLVTGLPLAYRTRDALSGVLDRLGARFCSQGLDVQAGTSGLGGSPANAMEIIDFRAGVCGLVGARVSEASAVSFRGGSIEGCGYSASGYAGIGLHLDGMGKFGARGASIDGMYFELNKGVSDILITGGAYEVVHSIRANFLRADVANYTQHNILTQSSSGALPVTVDYRQCGFAVGGNYVPSSSRRAVDFQALSGSPVYIPMADRTNIFGSATEVPQFSTGALTARAMFDPSAGNVGGSNINVSSVTKLGTGQFRLNLASFRHVDTARLPNLIVSSGPAGGYIGSELGRRWLLWAATATTLEIWFQDSVGTLADPTGQVSVSVYD